MEKQERYRQMQAVYVEENDLRVGDKVKVLRSNTVGELGSYVPAYGQAEIEEWGAQVEVRAIGYGYIAVKIRDGLFRNMPFFVLEIVDQPREPEITCKYFAKNKEGKLVEYEMSPDSARNYHKAMGEK